MIKNSTIIYSGVVKKTKLQFFFSLKVSVLKTMDDRKDPKSIS